jgi:hypothetical protein
MTQSANINAPWSLHFDRDGTEDFGTICDADGDAIVSSQHCKTCWLPESPDDCLEPPILVHQLQIMAAAPKLLTACKLALAALESALEAEDPQACTQMEWEAEPLATMRAAIAEAEGTEP